MKQVFKFIKNINYKTKFDIIFMDPPYKENKINELLGLIIFEKKYFKKKWFTNFT